MSEAILIRPITITTAMLISSNAEETYDLFDDSEPYVIYDAGDIVRSNEDNQLYESLIERGSSFLPTYVSNDPLLFEEVAHGLIDGEVITFTTGTGPFPNELQQGYPYRVHVVDADNFSIYSSNLNLDPDNLLSLAPGQTIWYYFCVRGDPNTGWWGDPTTDLTQSPLYSWATFPRWLDIGANNTWAMFDALNGSATTRDEGLEVEIHPGTRIDAAGFEGLVGATLQFVMNNGSTDVYDETFALVNNDEVTDWYSFFFAEREQRSTLLIDDLPSSVTDPQITITLSAPGGTAEIGTMSIGRKFALGNIELGLELGSRSYSIKEANDFGNYTVTQRGISKKAEGRAILANTRIDPVRKVLDDLDTVPVFWRLSESYDSATIFGFYRSFNIEVTYPNQSLVSYEIEGVI